MSNGAAEIAEEFRKKYGRSAEDVLEVALTYIDRQDSLAAWEDHLDGSLSQSLNDDVPQNLWGLFDDDLRPSIQKVDDYAPDGYTDADAAVAFVEDLEDGKPDAVAAATTILAFHRKHAGGRVAQAFRFPWRRRRLLVDIVYPSHIASERIQKDSRDLETLARLMDEDIIHGDVLLIDDDEIPEDLGVQLILQQGILSEDEIRGEHTPTEEG